MYYILYTNTYIFLIFCVYLSVPFTDIFIIFVLFISPCGFDLPSGIISPQPEGLPLVSLI